MHTTLTLSNIGTMEMKTLNLPMTEQQFDTEVNDLTYNGMNDCEIVDVESEYKLFTKYLDLPLVAKFNKMLQSNQELGDFNILVDCCDELEDAVKLFEEGNYLIHEASTDEELGHSLMEARGYLDHLPEEVTYCFDYDDYGFQEQCNGLFYKGSEHYIEVI
ncbi:antirestriction protein ArdA [Geomicrobium sp. JCM 19055]|uniref:antirestriction protein ArdA n=1 Tax=Geomicrobium sp. JCM 19055 TaxID=1460649 RepID=UPI00187C0096|nr:antirestriction protein ArdA [Geomicrobium sp. JCM 19055]